MNETEKIGDFTTREQFSWNDPCDTYLVLECKERWSLFVDPCGTRNCLHGSRVCCTFHYVPGLGVTRMRGTVFMSSSWAVILSQSFARFAIGSKRAFYRVIRRRGLQFRQRVSANLTRYMLGSLNCVVCGSTIRLFDCGSTFRFGDGQYRSVPTRQHETCTMWTKSISCSNPWHIDNNQN